MSKWKIRLENTMFMHPDEDDSCYGPRWCITSPTGVNWGNKATFAEAIAYADEEQGHGRMYCHTAHQYRGSGNTRCNI